MGMYCNDEQLGTMIVFQGGMNMQLLPAFGLGFLGFSCHSIIQLPVLFLIEGRPKTRGLKVPVISRDEEF